MQVLWRVSRRPLTLINIKRMTNMNDKDSVTGDAHLDWQVITLAVVECDFDLEKAAKRLREAKFGGMRRILDALARWETHITNLERTTNNPETRLAYRRMLASIRNSRHPARSTNRGGIDAE